MMQLQSYVMGRWHGSQVNAVALRDATTGAVIAQASSDGIDFWAVLDKARQVGGRGLFRLTFHECAACLKALAKRLTELKAEFYALSFATGPTKYDSAFDIDGGISTLFVFAKRG